MNCLSTNVKCEVINWGLAMCAHACDNLSQLVDGSCECLRARAIESRVSACVVTCAVEVL